MATAEGEHGSDFEETMFCEPCNKEGITAEADGFCSNCSDYLCSTCLRYHKRLTKDHTLFDKSSMPQDFCLERCVFHPNDLVKFYCTKCDDTACSQCIPIKHQTEYCEIKHIPSYMHSQDVYREMSEVKKSLKAVEEEAIRTGDESGQKLKTATLNRSDISKSISLQKKYIVDKIEEQRIQIFKALDDERVEFIRKLDERQGQRKEQLFEQQKLINNKIDDEANHFNEQLMLYPRKIQNIAQNSANIRSKSESLTNELVNKERQGRNAELFVATKRIKQNMKTLQIDIDDVREENTARWFTFRRNTENISIDAAENATLGSLIEESEESEQSDRDTTIGQLGAFNSTNSSDTRISSVTDFAENNIAVEEVQRDVASEEIRRPDACGGAEDPEYTNQLVSTAVNAAGQAYITAKAVFKTWQEKQDEAKRQARVERPTRQSIEGAKSQNKKLDRYSRPAWKSNWMPPSQSEPAVTQYALEFKRPQSEYKPPQSERTSPKPDFKVLKDDWRPPADDYNPPQSKGRSLAQSEPALPKDQWKSPAEVGPMAFLLEIGFLDTDLNKKLLTKHNDNLDKVVQELLSMKNNDWFVNEYNSSSIKKIEKQKNSQYRLFKGFVTKFK